VQTCLASLRGLGLPASPGTVAFGTDAGVFQSEAGIAGVVMGPGSIQRAHTAREYVEIDQVESMTRFFTALLTSI
jgi:acetylornithine deacetylase